MQDSRPASVQVKRRIALTRLQLLGIPLFFLIPALAVAGVFGPSRGQLEWSSETLQVQVEYPARLRYKVFSTLDVTVRNLATQDSRLVEVHFSRSYAGGFSELSFSPSVTRVTDDAYVVELGPVPSRAEHTVSVAVRGEGYGRLAGTVLVSAGGESTEELAVSTWTFP